MFFRTFAAAALCALSATAAQAQDCKPLRYLTGVPMDISRGLILFPAKLNDQDVKFFYDSGGITYMVTSATVDKFKLAMHRGQMGLIDASGNEVNGVAQVDTFTIGAWKSTAVPFQLSPPIKFDDDIAGSVTNVMLNVVDLDLDFGAHRMNLFLPDHCPNKTIYWPADAVAALPIKIEVTKISIPVTLDGVEMDALIDTGTTFSSVSLPEAQRAFNLTPASPGVTPMREGLNGDPNLMAYEHRFSSLSFEGVTIKNPSLALVPDRVNSRLHETIPGSHVASRMLALPRLIIGLDILSKLHVYISYRERMLYITPADDKAGKLLPPVVEAASLPSP